MFVITLGRAGWWFWGDAISNYWNTN